MAAFLTNRLPTVLVEPLQNVADRTAQYLNQTIAADQAATLPFLRRLPLPGLRLLIMLLAIGGNRCRRPACRVAIPGYRRDAIPRCFYQRFFAFAAAFLR